MNPSVPEVEELPERFGPYRILRKLGAGGMAAVYLAEDTRLDREVALKVPRLDLDGDRQILERFDREARAASRLDHPNLCHVYEVGEIDGRHYLTMSYVKGRPLSDHIPSYADRPPRAAAALVRILARALQEAHARGVVHRDLKPGNIVLNERGQPVVVDFGIALRLDPDAPRLTRAGAPLGTPAYMAPEQESGSVQAIGPGCDVYSLGVILYELLTGRRPFEGSPAEIRRRKLSAEFVPPSRQRAGLDAALDEVCRKALAGAVADRFPSMAAFADALTRYVGDEAIPAPGGSGPVAPAYAAEHDERPAGQVGLASPPSVYPSDPQVAQEVLNVFRDWGWEEGLARLRAKIWATEDAAERGALQLLAGWMASDRGVHGEAADQFRAAAATPELEGWALLGQAFLALRSGDPAAARLLLDQVAALGTRLDPILRAGLAHCRGTLLYKQARNDEALERLFEALELFGPNHFGTGRVLDTLGMVYAARDDFPTANLFYQRALEAKRGCDDLTGLALSYGQLGRLCLDWDRLPEAEEYFRKDQEICRRVNDARGEAQMYNHLGQVFLANGQAARAADFLDESVRRSEVGQWQVAGAYALKDRALARLALNRNEEAESDARRAVEQFVSAGFAEGAFYAKWALAQILAARGEQHEAKQLLWQCATYFDEQGQQADAARMYLELARVRKADKAPPSLVAETLGMALDRAERCRRDLLMRAIERELSAVDEAELCRRVYRRARGRGIREDTTSLSEGTGDRASVFFLDLCNFTGYALAEDPRFVLLTLNQVFAELAQVLERHDIIVNQYLGDGFMALARGSGHARRAVAAGLELLSALEKFNRPRRVLDLQLLQARIGIATGDVVFGNVGTHRKIDFTAVGPTTNLAARLQSEALPGSVCIARWTYDRVKAAFTVRDPNGREVVLKGIGTQKVWDVLGRRDTPPVSPERS